MSAEKTTVWLCYNADGQLVGVAPDYGTASDWLRGNRGGWIKWSDDPSHEIVPDY